MAKLRLHITLPPSHSLGPGKIQLLEGVRDLGSISAAARSMNMAYRHAWLLIQDMNQCFRSPVIHTSKGGRAGGGARLTPFGEELTRRFREMERTTHAALAQHLQALEAQCAVPLPSRSRGPRGRGGGDEGASG